jgi:hypothetical protein
LNILTKISVVVLVLLVVVFCPVLITMATQQPVWRAQTANGEARLALLQQDSRQKDVIIRRGQIDVARETERANAAQGQLAADRLALGRQLDDEKAKVADLLAKLGGMDMTLKKFQQDLSAMEKRNVDLVSALDAQRAEVNKKTEEIQRLASEVNQQTLLALKYQDDSTYQRQARAETEDKLQELEKRIKEGASGVGPSKGAAAPEPPAGGIRGTVDAVKADIASVGIGAAKGIRSGMVATVSRGKDYVCQIQFTDVNPNSAAGVIAKRKMDPAAGDTFEIYSER